MAKLAENKPMDKVKKSVEGFIRHYERYIVETDKDNPSNLLGPGVLAKIELAGEFISDLKNLQKLLQ